MRRAALAGLALAVLWGGEGRVSAQEAGWRTRPPEDSPTVSYVWDEISLEPILPGEGVQLNGHGKIVWRNSPKERVGYLYFHAYANAFSNSRSTFMRERARNGDEPFEDVRWGFMDLPMLEMHGDPLTPEWVSPDDGNPDDRTVFRVKLPEPVEKGEEVVIRVTRFQVKMPKAMRRMGTMPGFVMGAQWFPKLGMYVGLDAPRQRDGWYCPQYHANCEFAADYGNYKVTLKVPRDYHVVATGTRAGEDTVEGEVRTSTWHADNVVDFAWTAAHRDRTVVIERKITPIDESLFDDPVTFEWRRVKSQLDASDLDMKLPDVNVVLLLQSEHADQAERYFRAAQVALGLFGTWLGPYPYPQLTIVDPPSGGKALDGMAYPTLVVAGTSAHASRETQRPEDVVVHEICHQWMMNLLASNEAEEAWLDEGLATYLTAQALHLAYGGPARQTTTILGFEFPGVPVQEVEGVSNWPAALGLPSWTHPRKMDVFRIWRDLPPLTFVAATRYGPDQDPVLPARRSYLRREGLDAMVKSGWTYADRDSYRVNAHARPALFLDTLRRRLESTPGVAPDEARRRFTYALREYAREFRFRHPTTEDFLKKIKEPLGDPAPLADQLIRGAAVLDYAVVSIKNGDAPDFAGFDQDGDLVRAPAARSEKEQSTIVRVQRKGDAILPLVLEVRKEDGSRERREWPAAEQTKDRWRDFSFQGVVRSARLDPDGLYLQDSNLSDNSRTREPNARAAVKWSVRFVAWLENALMSYGRLF